MANSENAKMEAALAYAAKGLNVFPVHSVRDGRCSCSNPNCRRSKGKHPRTRNGFKDATTNPETIKKWWKRWPDANIGIPTGSQTGLVALDVDPRNGGNESFYKLQEQNGRLPTTKSQHTGGGGQHFLFQHPQKKTVKSRDLDGYKGVEVKADGAYILVPPSKTERPYRWVDAKQKPAALPLWLLDLVVEKPKSKPLSLPDKIPVGQRNKTLFSLALSMRHRGFSPEAIFAALQVENGRCEQPLGEDELRRISESAGRYPPQQGNQGERPQENPWTLACPAPEFLTIEEEAQEWYEENVLAPGFITEMFSPRGIGKTLVAHGIGVRQARNGKRVLLLDRDNGHREIQRRLREWGAENTPTFKVLTRDQVPPLTDRAAWQTFPFFDYDIVIIDALDATTEGIGEKDSAKPSKAIAPILDIAHRAGGPSMFVLGNTVKSGKHSRGSGVIEDRADIVFEVRDATDLRPTSTKDWWSELPPAGADKWAERASRRKGRDRYHLAFVPTKFRVGEEPDPFIWEIDLSGDQWRLEDVTDKVVQEGQTAKEQAREKEEERIEEAVQELAEKIKRAADARKLLRKEKDAVPLLRERGFTVRQARELIDNRDGRHWQILQMADQKGKPKVLLPVV
ncbi:bifunctional DNA primase/polymerase [Acidobacteria bacterium AH-259-L09]|nr:bifunctional DNA primase/polymerase [Acidobacteria bacterium AH-259-L09]